MALIKSIILTGLIISFFLGQLFRFQLLGIDFPMLDIFLVLFTFVNLIERYPKRNYKNHNRPFMYFLIFAFFSLLLNSYIFHFPLKTPIFYFIRLACLLSFFIHPPSITPVFRKFFIISIIANIIFGLFQYIFWSDFTSFGALNWDPHLYRLVSTFFDPTFTGLIYIFFIIYLYHQKKYWLIILPYLALALTYSRSSLLSLFVAAIFVGLKTKNKLIPILTGLLIFITILILPRQPGEGTKLERDSSIKAKIENYKEGFKTFSSSPIIGHGYNNLLYIRQINNPKSHSNSGFDGSLMTILVTTGLIGFCLFVSGFIQLYRKSSIFHQTMLVAIFVHSLFANSLLYPWTLIFLVLI